MNCPDENRWLAFLRGGASSRELDELDRHLDECGACQELLALCGRTSLVRAGTDDAVETAETAAAPDPAELRRGDSVGRYVVIDRVGAGAMGVVFAAYDPELDRKVALKLLHGEGSGAPTELRLLREARALARLAHAHVVAVHDVGAIGDRVFVVMEFIEGETLGEWLRTPRPWRTVVQALVQAGQGLAAAHRAGLVHRDFKPANVMVRRDGRIAVLDFGLAHLGSMSDSGQDTALPAGEHAIVSRSSFAGTPAYMAPEQLGAQVADALSDQFSFCVVLYEALYRCHPFGERFHEIAAAAASEAVRPPPPTDVPGFVHEVILRGLRADRAARHASMDALLLALARDRSRTLARRLSAVLGIALLLVAASAVGYRYARQRPALLCKGAERKLDGIWDAQRANAIHDAFLATNKPYAAESWRHLQEIVDAYTKNWVAMHADSCEATRVRGDQSDAVLDLRMQCLDRKKNELKALSELLAGADGQIVEKAVQAARSLSPLDGCADLRYLTSTVNLPADSQKRGKVLALRADLAAAQMLDAAGQFKQAEALALPAVKAAQEVGFRPVEAEALYRLGIEQLSLGDAEQAEKSLYDAVWAAEASRQDEIAAEAWLALVDAVGYRQARVAEAQALVRRATAAVERQARDPRLQIRLLRVLGNLHVTEGKYDAAYSRFEEAAALTEKTWGKNDPYVARIVNAAGTALENLGRYDEALSHYERARAIQERSLGPEHPDVAYTLQNLGVIASYQGKYDQALLYHRRALTILEGALGSENPAVAEEIEEIAVALHQAGKDDLALARHRQAVAIAKRTLGAAHPTTARFLAGMAETLKKLGRREEALRLHRQALAIKEQALGSEHPSVAASLVNLGIMLHEEGDDEVALAHYERALAIFQKVYGREHLRVAETLSNVSVALRQLGRVREALAAADEALKSETDALGSANPNLVEPLMAQGQAYLDLRRYREAITPLERALKLLQSNRATTASDLAEPQFALARALWGARTDSLRASKLAVLARSGYVQRNGPGAGDVVAVDKWLAKHSAPMDR